MGIFSRTRDIVAANMTELLDRAEDPAKMIRLIIAEMEETLVEVRASAARTIADAKEMRRHGDKLADHAHAWEEKAELALSRGREDLAKAALVERQKAVDMRDRLASEVALLDETLRGYEADIAKLQTKLRDARARQSGIAARMEAARNKLRLREAYGSERVKDAWTRFETLERRADLAEGRADAAGIEVKSLADEIAELGSSDKVEAALAELKARRGATSGPGEA